MKQLELNNFKIKYTDDNCLIISKPNGVILFIITDNDIQELMLFLVNRDL